MEPKSGDIYRHKRHGWTCDVDWVGWLPCIDDAQCSEWAVRYLSEHGIGQLSERRFLEQFEKVDEPS